ncbi:MAG: type II toxin-antitoxin system RelE/ParE family toxin [Planctomycetes bacterium]|nr:type II toxin-antitoxin system RelE/ParE family toxin [Planctomycetota bacterium]MCA8937384.1 type II toxin-antitoxin system RelE/ParE family toxin [Planctomycetota bacterium]
MPDFWIDVVESAEWFDEQRRDLGREFVAAVDAAIDKVLENPHAYRTVATPTRRFIIKRFQQLVFYEAEAENVLFLGVVHGSREVNRWLQRRRG